MHDFTPIPAAAGGAPIGWGIGGYCPGPALTALSTLSLESAVFVAAMIAGGLPHRFVIAAQDPAQSGKSGSEPEF